MSELTLLLVLVIGLVAGFIDSVLGAGGLVSIPSLIFLGLPAQIAIATDRLGTLGQSIAALFKFWKAKRIVWKYVPIFTVISLIGAVLGAKILLDINTEILQQVVGILIIILLPLIFIRRDVGIKKTKATNLRTLIGLTLYFFIMIFAGFFGQGVGPLVFYTSAYFLGFTMIEVLATGVIPWLILSVASLVIFAMNGIIEYKVGLVLFVGMAIGGYAGAHTAIKKGDLWVKRLFIIFVIVSAIKLLFF